MDPLWLSTAEAAIRLGVTTRTVYGFINDGSLPGYRMGRKIQVLAADVEAFIESVRIRPGSFGAAQRPELVSHEAERSR